jgi:hypothetical protein
MLIATRFTVITINTFTLHEGLGVTGRIFVSNKTNVISTLSPSKSAKIEKQIVFEREYRRRHSSPTASCILLVHGNYLLSEQSSLSWMFEGKKKNILIHVSKLCEP